jgi:predicted GH43/DUF377 family glycosyl hydrolase
MNMKGLNSKRSKKELFRKAKLARYNLASWQTKGGNTFVIFREIARKGKIGEPDFTNLVLVELDKNLKPIHERIAWQPTGVSFFLEDPRAFTLSDDSVVIGLTALLRGDKGEYVPYPALTYLKTDEWREVLPAVTIIETFGPGKNTTPIEKDYYFFRRDGRENSHKLLVFSLFNMIPKERQTLNFPNNLPWAKLRIGTAMPPLWLDGEKALMIFHGISVVDGKNIYSLGRAGLKKSNGTFSINVISEPIITPDFFLDKEGKPLVKELHPELRRVVYCCGGILKPKDPKTLILFVNVGDFATFLVEYSLDELTKDLF